MILEEGEKERRAARAPLEGGRSKNYIAPKAIPHNERTAAIRRRWDERGAWKARHEAYFLPAGKWMRLRLK